MSHEADFTVQCFRTAFPFHMILLGLITVLATAWAVRLATTGLIASARLCAYWAWIMGLIILTMCSVVCGCTACTTRSAAKGWAL